MTSKLENKLADFFKDVDIHKTIANIITKHMSNNEDIRELAIRDANLKSFKSILDLGCGYGFFIEILKNKVHADAQIMGIDSNNENKNNYLEACSSAGLNGTFLNSDISILKKIYSDSYDFILSSYSLYFFPEIIPEIFRILKKDGIFITLTHAKNHLKELFDYVKCNLSKKNNISDVVLPYEQLISNFTDENAYKLLSPYFKKIKKIDYISSLIFNEKDISDLITYLKLKYIFYIENNQKAINNIVDKLKKDIITLKEFSVTKDDVIYICSKTESEK